MNNGLKALLILIGVMMYIFAPPLMYKLDYAPSLALWIPVAAGAFLTIVSLICLIKRAEEAENDMFERRINERVNKSMRNVYISCIAAASILISYSVWGV